MSETQLWLAVGTVAGSAITALFGGSTALLGMLLKYRRDKQQDQVTAQWEIIDRQEKQIARLEAHVREQQEALEKMREALAAGLEDSAKLRLYVAVLREDMINAGLQPRDMPPLREREGDAEFVAKTVAANTELLAKVDEKLKAADPSGGGHANPGN